MKKLLISAAIILLGTTSKSQNVGIGTSTPQEKLEVKNSSRSTLKISSSSYFDTTQLILSNKTAADAGTDFRFTSLREEGLKLSSTSDIGPNNVDAIMMIKPTGQVGINNVNPTERLDVAGNINVSGTIKANGADGAAGQVLMKNSSGGLAWGNMCAYPNSIGFTPASGANGTTNFTWVVPANINKIKVEAWGAGGGGSSDVFTAGPHGACGGGGGGYLTTNIDVTPGTTCYIAVGGGWAGSVGFGNVSDDGQLTTFGVGSVLLIAGGGYGGTSSGGGEGGAFNYSPSTLRVIALEGNAGESFNATYGTFGNPATTTTISISMKYGNGGAAGNTSYAVKNGGFRVSSGSNGTLMNASANRGIMPGGGGGASYSSGGRGANGMVIIHY
ncbi:MAG: hypothetical protein EOO13_07800 [Chitinophagaceae bacterium]|nr:MAG: hypothetical protein EOO13_07800 [Chitinophagaceae bacterium]